MSRDLRDWIDLLESENELKKIAVPVNWNGEIAEIQRRVNRKGGPAILYEAISGHEHTWCRRMFSGGLTTLGRVALMLGLPKETSKSEIVQLLRKRFREPIAPMVMQTGPVKDEIIKGDAIDLAQIPVPQWHPADAGRYINTWCGVVTRDPENGVHNVGLYRAAIGGKSKIKVMMNFAQNWGIHYRKYQQMKQPMPVAMVYGWDPAMAFTAGLHFPCDEYGIMGSIRQDPVPLVRCETSDLMVPASAEIVIEGTVSYDPASYELEGPYGESNGYYSLARMAPVFEVTCITHRKDPIFRGAIAESGAMISTGSAALMWNTLDQQDIPGIIDVEAFPVTAIKIHKTYQGQAKHVASALWGSRLAVTQLKTILVVDDERDFDIHNPLALQMAAFYFINPKRGIIVYPMEMGPPTDIALSIDEQDVLEYGATLEDKMLVDATVDWVTHKPLPEWDGHRSPPSCNSAEPEVIRQVDEKWSDYNI